MMPTRRDLRDEVTSRAVGGADDLDECRDARTPMSTPPTILHLPLHPRQPHPPLLLSPSALARELLAMTDRYTDELFALPASAATTITFPVSRLVVDPERFLDDALESMSQRGMGVLYERTSTGAPLRSPPSADERRHLLAQFYEPHHAALRTRAAWSSMSEV
jgi:N-formylglutamate amidohydrolase